ncbi:MAG: hypothetical protein PVF22_06440 [Candidatus Aminicenantes bacterium]
MRIKITNLFFAANMLLLAAGWTAAVLAYRQLPDKIPLWVNFFGEPVFFQEKSPLFFLYAASQTIFCILFIAATRILLSRQDEKTKSANPFSRELAYLALIFFNLIFIHIQTSLIFLAHRADQGVNRYYFFMLFVIILMLIPYYRIRTKILAKTGKRHL